MVEIMEVLNLTSIWLILMAVLIVLELIIPSFSFFIWFATGAGICAILSYFQVLSPQYLLIVFVILSSILVFATKPLQRKLAITKDKNIDTKGRITGKRVEVIEEINNFREVGKVYLEGSYWRARSEKDEEICKQGDIVEVINVDGIYLIVKKNKED